MFKVNNKDTRTTPMPVVVEPFFRMCIQEGRKDLCQIVILGAKWHFRWWWFFPGGTWKLSVQKIVNANLKQKIDSKCSFYNLSLLVPYPNNFLVVCICICIFHGVYNPLPHLQIFFLWRAKKFFVSCSQGLGKFQTSWGPSVQGGPNFLFGRGRLGHFLP